MEKTLLLNYFLKFYLKNSKNKIELSSSPIEGQYDKAAEIFKELTLSEDFVDFLTLPAYEEIS